MSSTRKPRKLCRVMITKPTSESEKHVSFNLFRARYMSVLRQNNDVRERLKREILMTCDDKSFQQVK